MELRTHAYSAGPVVRAIELAERLGLVASEAARAVHADLRAGKELPLPARLAERLGLSAEVMQTLVLLAAALAPERSPAPACGKTVHSDPRGNPEPPTTPTRIDPGFAAPLPRALAAADGRPAEDDSEHLETLIVGESGPAAGETAPGKATWRPESMALLEEVARASTVPSNRFGRYVILSLLGSGGMGVVRRAWDTSLARLVALKWLRDEAIASSPVVVERFLREARAAARLRHPAIVAVHDVGEIGGRLYLTMDYIEGGSLAAEMDSTAEDRRTGKPGALRGLPADMERFATIAEAVGHAHALGIVHRDLKPANVLLDRDGHPHVSDFGLAKDLHASEGISPAVSLTGDGSLLGTPAYMSPEQASGSKTVGPASDVFSLGVMLFESLTGRLPFLGPSVPAMLLSIRTEDPPAPRKLSPRLPRDLETVCLKCLERDPARRYPDAGALAADLRRWLAGEPVEARPVALGRRAARWVRRHPFSAGAAAFAFALSLAVTAVQVREQRRFAEQTRRREAFRDCAAAELAAWRVGDAARQDRLRQEAAILANQVLEDQPDQADVILDRGRLRLRADNLAGAQADFDRVIALLGDRDAVARAERGRLWIRRYLLGLEEARKLLPDPARASDASDGELEKALPDLLTFKRRAQEDLEAASRIGLHSAERALVEAHLARLAGDWAAVQAAARASLREDASAEGYWLLGTAAVALSQQANDGASGQGVGRQEYERRSRWAEALLRDAIEALDGALALGRGSAEAWLARAEARGLLVEHRRHGAILEILGGRRPDNDVDALAADLDAALADMRQAKAFGAHPEKVGRLFGYLAWEKGEIVRKTEPFRRRLTPREEPESPFRAALVRRAIGPLITELESLEPRYHSSDLLFRLGQLYECWANSSPDDEADTRDELRHARDLLAQALDRNPGYARAQKWHAITGYELAHEEREHGGFPLGHFRRAIVEFDAALLADPGESWVRFWRADCWMQLGEWRRVRGAGGWDDYRRALAAMEPISAEDVPNVLHPRIWSRVLLFTEAQSQGDDVSAEVAKARADLGRIDFANPVEASWDAEGWTRAAEARLAAKRGEDASARFRAAAEAFRKDPHANLWMLAWAADSLHAAGATREALALFAEHARYPQVEPRYAGDATLLAGLDAIADALDAAQDPALAAGALDFARVAARLAVRAHGARLRDVAFRALAAGRRLSGLSWSDLEKIEELEGLREDARWGK